MWTLVVRCHRHQATPLYPRPRHTHTHAHIPHPVGGGLSGSLSAWVGQGMSTETYSWWLVYSVVNGVHICPPRHTLSVCVIISHSIACVHIVHRIHAYEWVCVHFVYMFMCINVCVCVSACIHVCGQSVCIMNSHRDSRVVVKGVSSPAHHTSQSHFQTVEAPEKRRGALWSSSDKTSCCVSSSYYTLIWPGRLRPFEAIITHKAEVCAWAGKTFSKDEHLCQTDPVMWFMKHKT